MIEQLIKDLCKWNRKNYPEVETVIGAYRHEVVILTQEDLDQITQQTAEAVLSAVREYIEDQDGILYRDTLLTTLEEEVSK